MPLHFAAPPPSVYTAYQQSIADLMGPASSEVPFYHVPVGTLALEEAARGASLSGLQSPGCRFLASWPDGTWTSCELTNPTTYASAEFRNFMTGDFAALALQRIAEAQGLSAVQSGEYVLNLLTIPGIYLEALHLVNQGNGSDLILPIVSMDPRLGVDGVFDSATFLEISREIAAARLAKTSTDPLSS